MLDGIKLFSISMEFLIFCTWLTFDLFLRPRNIYRLGIHPYEFWHMSRNDISISRIMYSKMPTKRKISIFFGFGWPSNNPASNLGYLDLAPHVIFSWVQNCSLGPP